MTAAANQASAIAAPAAQPDRFLTVNEVSQRIGFKTTWIYTRMKRGEFPAAFKVGGCSSRWSENDIVEWMEAQKRQRAA